MFRCFVFTDIQDSTGLWARFGEAFRPSLDLHHATIREVLREHGGQELTEAGDGFLLAFEQCEAAVRYALALQQRLADCAWPPVVGPLAVRVGIHAGEVEPRENGEYRGLVLNRASRIRDTAHGGQIICSSTVAKQAAACAEMHERGTFRLRGMPAPERLFQVSAPGEAPRQFPPLRAVPAYRHNLPGHLSRFVGREKPIAKLRALLSPAPTAKRTARLVTLTGPGGTGKTRLAIATAETLLAEYSHAVWFVPLADIQDAHLIVLSIREALGIEPDPAYTALEQVAAFIAEEPAVFVLDNFEQLAESSAGVIEQLLGRMPALRLLVTSRHRLHLPQEREFAVPALETPRDEEDIEGVESVALFVDRASHANPAFELTESNAPAIAELCRKLEGVPLAIELAAARAAVRTPREIVQELGDRLDAFASADPHTPARHRSLRAAIDWSFEYLPQALRSFLANLSVFRGGWTAEAAVAVAAPEQLRDVSSHVLRSLSELRALSLIVAEERQETMRFRMLETIRQYAAERVPEESREALGERHLLYFEDFATEAEKGCNGHEQVAWLNRIELEHDNFRAALRFPTRSDAPLRIASDLAIFWMIRGHAEEGRALAAQLLADHPDADPLIIAWVDTLAGNLAQAAGDPQSARAPFERALAYFRSIDDRKNISALLTNLSTIYLHAGDLPGARSALESSIQISRELGRAQTLAPALANLGFLLIDGEDYPAARAVFDEALAIQRSLGDARTIANIQLNRAFVFRKLGELDQAQTAIEECVALCRSLRDRSTLTAVFHAQAEFAVARAQHAEAARFVVAASQAFCQFGGGFNTISVDDIEKTAETIKAQLSAEEWAEAERLGQALVRDWLRA